jgi:hypothetical protein
VALQLPPSRAAQHGDWAYRVIGGQVVLYRRQGQPRGEAETQAARVSGYVADAQSGECLHDAKVAVINQQTSRSMPLAVCS